MTGDSDESQRTATDPDATRRAFVAGGVTVGLSAIAGCSGLLGGGAESTPTVTPTLSGNSTVAGPTATPSSRVQDLVDKMSVQEKAFQMMQMALKNARPSTHGALIEKGPVGSIIVGGARSYSLDPKQVAKTVNELQSYATKTDLGIPMIAGIDAVHGNATVTPAPVFPHNVGMGATWNTDLAKQRGQITGRSIRGMGFHWNFSPVADLCYDPRWGRFYEGFSESAAHASALVSNAVAGIEQASNGHKQAAATVKHFAGYSAPTNGNDRTDADVSPRMLRSRLFPPYRAGIEANAESVMVNSGSVNGVPAHASEWLLKTKLRDHWGFDGLVLSDWGDIRKLQNMHGVADDYRDALRIAIESGVDMIMVGYYTRSLHKDIPDLVNAGDLAEKHLDRAVTNILTLKESVGILDDGTVDPSTVSNTVVKQGDRAAARRAAEQSMTLLKNEGPLPLGSDAGSILLTGPNADDAKAQLGGWTRGWQGISKEDPAKHTKTIRDGLEQHAPSGTSVTHVPTGRSTLESGTLEEVESAAGDADVAVVVVGEGAYAEGRGDIDRLALPSAQQDVVSAVSAADIPVVGVMIAGRPRGNPALHEQFDDFLMAYYPGSEGGLAVAKTLFGKTDPAGRLPFTWPRTVGQVPLTHNQPRPINGPEPLYKFGTGNTYGSFSQSINGTIGPVESVAETPTLSFDVEISNDGDRAGDIVVPVMVSPDPNPESVKLPRRQVVGFDRFSLKAGATKTATMTADLTALATPSHDVMGDGPLVVPATTYRLTAGGAWQNFEVEQRARPPTQ
ncbi:MAG: glycoside hydrolase family 3 N-terminal domain-containing protein [Haloarculaceae archaeon]